MIPTMPRKNILKVESFVERRLWGARNLDWSSGVTYAVTEYSLMFIDIIIMSHDHYNNHHYHDNGNSWWWDHCTGFGQLMCISICICGFVHLYLYLIRCWDHYTGLWQRAEASFLLPLASTLAPTIPHFRSWILDPTEYNRWYYDMISVVAIGIDIGTNIWLQIQQNIPKVEIIFLYIFNIFPSNWI